jgi:hypothetical protein
MGGRVLVNLAAGFARAIETRRALAYVRAQPWAAAA